MTGSFIGAIDQGTTSTRFILYDNNAKAIASHQVEFEQIHPQAGWVEHDPLVILETVKTCMTEGLKTAERLNYKVANNVKAIGITNQRETSIIWRKSTGKPLYNAIVWMDARTAEICQRLEREMPLGRDHFRASTGLPISTYFSAVKLMWLIENVPAVASAVAEGDALFGTMESWLVWNMTGSSKIHITDCSNASRTLLMSLEHLQWDKDILESLKIPSHILPKIVSNAEVVGHVSTEWGPLAGTPISSCLGDQHAALLGQRCQPGQAKATYGTGCFLLYNTGLYRQASSHGLLSTMAFKLGPSVPPQYALEGAIAIAGAAVQWLRDSLGIIKQASEIEDLAGQVKDTGGLYFVPAFGGLFAPRWREDARGVLVGISRYTGRAHIALATLEGIAFQAVEVINAMQSDVGENEGKSFVLRVDGGASENNLLMQLQADLLGSPVVRPEDTETTALGAALAAGLGVGLWTEEDIFGNEARSHGGRRFEPEIAVEERKKRLAGWERAVEKSYGLADSPSS